MKQEIIKIGQSLSQKDKIKIKKEIKVIESTGRIHIFTWLDEHIIAIAGSNYQANYGWLIFLESIK